MIASLGMYDRAETAAANDRLWAGIRDHLRRNGIAAPEALTRGAQAYWDAWTDPDLTFSQTCGYPFRARLHDQVTLIGTPDYALPDCPPGHYYSVYIARRSDPRAQLSDFDGADFAYNEPMSQSGWAAPQTHAKALGLRLPPGLETGGHRLSALAVAEGRADLAALDAVTWAMLHRHEPFAQTLRVIGRTDPPTPVLPYIAAKGVDADVYFDAIQTAIAALTQADRDALLLRGVVRIAAEAYRAVPNPPTPDQIARDI
jgi:ABC-type phosphate/phosphonate transport system substrate-binding protein